MPISTYSQKKNKTAKSNPVTKPVTGKNAKFSVPNFGGGYSLKLTPEQFLEKFLILGVENHTFAVGSQQLLAQNTANIRAMIQNFPKEVVQKIREISSQRRALTKEPMLYTLALGASHPSRTVRDMFLNELKHVANTGTDLFHFAEIVTGMRGWGRMLKRYVGDWYTDKSFDSLVYQLLKYRQRDGWSHQDLLRLSHPEFQGSITNSFINYVVNGNEAGVLKALADIDPKILTKGGRQIEAFIEIQSWKENEKSDAQIKRLVELIGATDMTHEMIPTWFKNVPQVQQALLAKMPYMATVRQLSSLTASGLLSGTNEDVKTVVRRLTNIEQLTKAGIHPLKLLFALRTYGKGQGLKGSLTWKPVPKIQEALEEAFNNSFDVAPATGKNFMVSVDVSRSMSSMMANGLMSFCEAAATIALTIVKREPWCDVKCFSSVLNDLPLTKTDNISTAITKAKKYNTGYTDAGLPIKHAIKNKQDVDCFIHITDNDFNTGEHPLTLTQNYRKLMNKPKTRLMSLGMQSTGYGVAGFASDSDPYSLDVTGFDPNVTSVIHAFNSEKALTEDED